MQLDAGVKHELWKDLFVSLTLYNTYDSRPPNASANTNDVGVVTSIGWTVLKGAPKEPLMTTVTVLKFSTATGADDALAQIRRLQKQHLITLHDAAIVSWPEGQQAPKTKQLVDLITSGSIGGLFWGMLFGLIFITPLFGMVIGGAVGAIGGAFRDYGIDDNFIKSIRGAVTQAPRRSS